MIKDSAEISKKNERITLPFEILEEYLLALGIVAILTAAMYWIGRDVLGEGVIALLYLAPISWIAARWGQGPGVVAAVGSALAFDYLFIPPFYTFAIGLPESWLLLGIFLTVAIVIVGRIQVGLLQAKRRELEALMMYELSAELFVARSRETVARTLAAKIQQVYLTDLIQVYLYNDGHPTVVTLPAQKTQDKKPDLILPMMIGKDLIGEVCMWEGDLIHLSAEDRLINNLINQSARAIERARFDKTEAPS